MTTEILVPPHSIAAEEAVLGALLIDGEAMQKISGVLQDSHFYVVKNQWVYRLMCELHQRHEPIDFLTICQALESEGKLDEVGGESYVAQLTTAVPTALNVEAYAESVKAFALRRKAINVASDMARTAYDQSTPVEQVLAQSEEAVLGLGKDKQTGKFIPLKNVLGRVWDGVEDAFNNPDKPRGVPYTYSVMDEKFGNAERGALITIGARPGMGKTALLLSMAFRQAKQGIGVLFYPYEMTDEQLTLRLLAQVTGFGYKEIEYAQRFINQTVRPMNSEELDVIVRAMGAIESLPLYFRSDRPNVETFRSSILRAQSEFRIPDDKLVVYADYLQIMGTAKNIDNRSQEIGHMTGILKRTALDLRVPIIVASQLNRDVEKRADNRPQLSDLRESGSVEQDSDVVMFVYRDEVYNPDTEMKNIAEILVRKNRNGADGTAMLFWNGKLISFNDLAKERIEL